MNSRNLSVDSAEKFRARKCSGSAPAVDRGLRARKSSFPELFPALLERPEMLLQPDQRRLPFPVASWRRIRRQERLREFRVPHPS